MSSAPSNENGKVEDEVVLPASFVRGGYEGDRPVIVERLETGELVTRSVDSHKPYVRAMIREMARQHRHALDILAAYDRGEATPLATSGSARSAQPADDPHP